MGKKKKSKHLPPLAVKIPALPPNAGQLLARTAARDVVNMVNIIGGDESHVAFVQEILRSHRTLQQGVGRLVGMLITETAKMDDGCYDLRNEAWVKLCKRLAPIVAESPLPLI